MPSAYFSSPPVPTSDVPLIEKETVKCKEMALIALIAAIFLTNRVTAAQINITAVYPDVNTLAGGATDVSTLQILQIREAAEVTPAASAGNNLNVVEASVLDPQMESQAISTIYSVQSKKNTDKKLEEGDKFPLPESVIEKNYSEFLAQDTVTPSSLVWDNCFESKFRDVHKNIMSTQNDMEEMKHNILPNENKELNLTIWNKRHVINDNNTQSMKVWVERYNSFKNGKIEERRQKKPDSIHVSKTTQTPTTLVPITTVKIVPITREIFVEPTNTLNITSDLADNDIMSGYTEDWFETKDRTKIKFGVPPRTETYLVPSLKLEEGFHPFAFMSQFFSLIYPFDFPVGLIKDIVWGKFTFPFSFLQAVKVESTFLIFIVVFCCIALVIPSYLLILALLALMVRSRRGDQMETGALFPEAEDENCRDRLTVVATLLVVLMCCLLISGMAVSNEQAHTAAVDSRNIINCACADLVAWMTSAARELLHSLVAPVDLVFKAFREDLRNIGTLLGEPIQKAIASESGIDMVLDSLSDIISECEDLSLKISSLRDMSINAGKLASSTSDRIRDLGRQLENSKKFCTAKDAPLCDTINTNSLEMMMKFDLILHEQQLLELHALGVENMTRAISIAKDEFRALPSAITTQTAAVREDILKDIEKRRQHVHSSSRVLSDIVRYLTGSLHFLSRQMESGHERVQRYEFWRWTVMLACITSFGFVMTLILISMLCGCGNAKEHGKRTLQVSTVWLCFTSLLLWAMIAAVFVIAGHAEIYICHALRDSPQYKTLSALLDRPSPLLSNNEGIFDAIFRDMENVTIDVSVKDVLRDCEKDRPAYVVFQLDKVLDVNKETSYFEWDDLQADLGRLASSIDVGFLKTVSAYFYKLLNDILEVSDVDLAKYRMEYNGPIVGKDLPALVDQLTNVAAQVSDLTTAGRLETLASRTRRLHTANIRPLEQLRSELVFKLTELELQLMPFRKKLNISLSHIHTAQFYIDNQGDVIAHKKVSVYVSRLLSHAAGWRTHVLVSTGTQAAKCGPLFRVYSGLRALLCSYYVASLHGWWVCGFLLGILWCTALTPLCVRLWRTYGRKIRAQEAMSLANLTSGVQETPATAMCEGSHWNTPGPPPPRSDSW